MTSLTSAEVNELSLTELRNECSRARLAVTGNSNTLRKRLRELLAVQAFISFRPKNKRQKKDPAADLICPITRELPWVPIIAQDGRIYEAAAIKTYFATQRQNGAPIKSPYTNAPMADTLLPVPHIKGLIETLVENEAIQGDALDAWNKKVKQMQKKDNLLQKANDGDSESMYTAARRYDDGLDGFEKDQSLAYQWYKKSHEAGNVKGTAMLGQCRVHGWGVEQSFPIGIHYLTRAAENGSDYAAYVLGKAFAKGRYGMTVNNKEAIFWLQKSLGDCAHQHAAESVKAKAQQFLGELQSQNIADNNYLEWST
ncbi:Sel1 domain protein repeat-containing protein [Seminavis robusta]|uniref:Sel1 domain protein repeat-containing protein n=1 Tax=Seminavis robusta TaxID=568900 RepID=A0A9N8EC11_9STRA|nr:Sel1 domain protein repeat-containing protein [Seminavis robusta]|eukprot:Sro870_g213590.1 Sel1 domain protein repeat-containing protein (312) ;mRNA; f:2431-3366